ncbi:MAG: chaperonin [Syntrophomonadaceae bacterium]|nr:chaperonin [Syntrophomonadaceae bacterium]
MADKVNLGQEIDDRFKTLVNNTTAARVVSQAVEGTIGPKGLDTMMVDSFGDVVITNDGITILRLMEINHPAAHMIINAARSQQDEVGDGTTTATIMASAMISEGLNQVLKGVPVAKVLEGIAQATAYGAEEIRRCSRPVEGWDDQVLFQVAKVAGRGNLELAELVVKAGAIIGIDQLQEPGYKFAEAVMAVEGGNSEVVLGVIVNQKPVNREMPNRVDFAKILVIDDALKPEDLEEGALRTELGFRKYLELKDIYHHNLLKIKEMRIGLVLADRSVDDMAEEILTDAGIMVVQRVSRRELERVCEHTGARMIKRNALNRTPEQLEKYLGQAELVQYQEDLENIRIIGGQGQGTATILVGAATSEVVEERERMARDAAAAVQAALKGGVVPGGGALEVWVASSLAKLAHEVQGMTSYGIQCVKEALEKPFSCIINNAGLNSLEKLVELAAVQQAAGDCRWAVNCDDGQVIDLEQMGVWDPALVKTKALEAASEVAMAILKINTVIKKRETG